MPKNYILCEDINGNPTKWDILNREKDCTLTSEDGNKIVDHLNQVYEENQYGTILVKSLKEQIKQLKKENQQLKEREKIIKHTIDKLEK